MTPHILTTLFLGIFFLFSWRSQLLAEVITIGGTVKDKSTLAPIDSARIEIVNGTNPSDRHTVYTASTGAWSFSFEATGVGAVSTVPTDFTVEQNYPNPFNPSTRIAFSIDRPGDVRFAVYTLLGQLLDERTYSVAAGNHAVTWRGKGAAGVLFYTVEFAGSRVTRKMIQLDGHAHGGFGELTTHGGRTTVGHLHKVRETALLVSAYSLLYMPDTTTVALTGNSTVDFTLETVHSRAFVFDLHNDVMEIAVEGGYDLGERHTINHSDLPRFREGGFDAQMFALWTRPADSLVHPFYDYTLAMIDTFTSAVNRNASIFVQARTYDELMQANARGKFAGVLAVEGGHAIENDIQKLRNLYMLGARYLTITWNNSTSWAVAASDSRTSTVGLSAFGRDVIRTMDSLGMIIDVAHTGIKTIWDILETTRNPIVDTHAGVRALNNQSRNLTDAQIDSIAARGGVIGVVFYPTFLSSKKIATIDTVIKHIDYIRNRVGVDYVAIGSDWDGIESTPVGLEDVSTLPNLTAALLRHGYSAQDVIKILGGNYLRVFKRIVG